MVVPVADGDVGLAESERVVVEGEVVDCDAEVLSVGVLEEEVDGVVEPGVQRPQVFWQKPSGRPGAAAEIDLHCPKLFCSNKTASVSNRYPLSG